MKFMLSPLQVPPQNSDRFAQQDLILLAAELIAMFSGVSTAFQTSGVEERLAVDPGRS
jgi:hypothetical protein